MKVTHMLPFETLLAKVDSLVSVFSARADEHDRNGTFAFENVEDLRAAGLHKWIVPVEYGGDGANLCEVARVLEQVSLGDASTSLGLAMHLHVVGSLAEGRYWQEEKFAQLCREIVDEKLFVNSVASEPQLGSPSRGGLPKTTARDVSNGFIINGRKRWTTWARALGYFLVTAEHDGAVSVFAVKHNSPGISFEDTWSSSLSLRASGSDDVIFDNVFVPARWLVMEKVEWPMRYSGLPSAWPTCAFAATYLGIGEAAIRETAKYANARAPTALGKPIAALPHVQRNIGLMHTAVQSARLALHDVARRWVSVPSERANMEADLAMAKYLCTNASIDATDLALRTAGASGLERKLSLERLFRDARAGLMHPPQDEKALEIIGKGRLMRAVG
jgi:alkylation response protein AidB-like acyl-CoA dehydrogenase